MRSLPTLLPLALAAAPAFAQQTSEPSSSTTTAATAATVTASATPSADKKDDDKKEEAPRQNARLAPGGLVGGSGNFPLHVTATLDNSFGNGILAPAFQMQPSWSSSLSLRPALSIPKLNDAMPKMSASMSIDFSVANWLPAYTNGGVYDREVRVSDVGLGLVMPALFTEELTKVSVSPVLSMRLPLSLSSRQQNLAASFAGSAQFAWNSDDSDLGSIFIQYTPAVRVNAYSVNGITMPCEVPQDYGTPRPVGDPVNGVDDLPLVLAREEQILPNGECVLSGRQSMGSFSNSGAAGWNSKDGAHNLAVSLAWSVGFLRPLGNAPELSSDFSSGQNFNETSSGSISYTYTVPVEQQVFLSVGIGSGQPAFTSKGDLRFPFYDFFTPANSFSAVSFDVAVGL